MGGLGGNPFDTGLIGQAGLRQPPPSPMTPMTPQVIPQTAANTFQSPAQSPGLLSQISGGAKSAWDWYRNPSDQRRQFGMALLGIGQGLLSRRPGEGFGPGLARGIGQAQRGYDREGSRIRASKFRDYIGGLTDQQMAPEMREAMMMADPSQVGPMQVALEGQMRAGERHESSAAEATKRARRQMEKEQTALDLAASRREEDVDWRKGGRKLSKKELKEKVERQMARQKSEARADLIAEAAGGDAQAIRTLEMQGFSWDVEEGEIIPEWANRFLQIHEQAIGTRRGQRMGGGSLTAEQLQQILHPTKPTGG